jgi:hypothetical protein
MAKRAVPRSISSLAPGLGSCHACVSYGHEIRWLTAQEAHVAVSCVCVLFREQALLIAPYIGTMMRSLTVAAGLARRHIHTHTHIST